MCVCVSFLYELCTQKYISSVQVVCSSTVYLHMNVWVWVCACVAPVFKNYSGNKNKIPSKISWSSQIVGGKIKGRGPFRCPESSYFTNFLTFISRDKKLKTWGYQSVHEYMSLEFCVLIRRSHLNVRGQRGSVRQVQLSGIRWGMRIGVKCGCLGLCQVKWSCDRGSQKLGQMSGY